MQNSNDMSWERKEKHIYLIIFLNFISTIFQGCINILLEVKLQWE